MYYIRIYLFSVDEPTNGSGRICFKAGAIEVNPIPQRVSLAFIAGNHRKPLREANDGQTASVLNKFKWRRIHCDLTHKAARSGQFYFLQGHLVHTRRNDLKKCQVKFWNIFSLKNRYYILPNSLRLIDRSSIKCVVVWDSFDLDEI